MGLTHDQRMLLRILGDVRARHALADSPTERGTWHVGDHVGVRGHGDWMPFCREPTTWGHGWNPAFDMDEWHHNFADLVNDLMYR